MAYTTVTTSTLAGVSKTIQYHYTLLTKTVGPGTICMWKVHGKISTYYIFESEYTIHKKVRYNAKKHKSTTVGTALQSLKNKQK